MKHTHVLVCAHTHRVLKTRKELTAEAELVKIFTV